MCELATLTLIGRGTFGQVFSMCMADGTKLALKIHKAGKLCASMQKEISILQVLKHPHVIPICGVSPTGFLMPRMLGHMPTVMKRPDLALPLGTQIFTALAYIHDKGIAHCDVKPANILVESADPLRIRLADFGNACDLACGADRKCLTTHATASPECFACQQHACAATDNDPRKCDVWAAAMCVMMVCGFWRQGWAFRRPTLADPNFAALFLQDGVLHARVHELCGGDGGDFVATFLLRTLVLDADLRPTAQECIDYL